METGEEAIKALGFRQFRVRFHGELVRLEIDRLENKIISLSELAVNRQEPGYVTSQVDQVAASE